MDGYFQRNLTNVSRIFVEANTQEVVQRENKGESMTVTRNWSLRRRKMKPSWLES